MTYRLATALLLLAAFALVVADVVFFPDVSL